MTSEDWNPATAEEADPPEMLLSYVDLAKHRNNLHAMLWRVYWEAVRNHGVVEASTLRDARDTLDSTNGYR